MMLTKDAAGIYYFDHSNHVNEQDGKLLKENAYLKGLLEEKDREINELKESVTKLKLELTLLS